MSEAKQQQLATLAVHAGQVARPRHRLPRRADLPDHLVSVSGRRPRRAAVCAEGVRQHLHAHHEPDDRRV